MQSNSNNIANAMAFVAEHLTERVYPETIEAAVRRVGDERCPLDGEVTDAISDLMDEYGQDNDLSSDYWDEKTAEEIFWELETIKGYEQ